LNYTRMATLIIIINERATVKYFFKN